jgi:hypothetical protein
MLLAGHQKLGGVEGAACGAGARQVKRVGAALQAASQGRTPLPTLPAPARGASAVLLLSTAATCWVDGGSSRKHSANRPSHNPRCRNDQAVVLRSPPYGAAPTHCRINIDQHAIALVHLLIS